MFSTPMVPYQQVVAAARETAEKICAQGSRKVTVTVTTDGGETASVMWDHSKAKLNLPTMPASNMMTRAEANQIVGLIAHECCHVMHSNWDAWQRACARGNAVRAHGNGLVRAAMPFAR